MISYSYSVLRYSHDASVGEQINVGVLIYAPKAGYVRFLSEHRTRVLSQLFRGFNREEFQRFLSWLEVAVENLQGSMALENLRLFDIENAPEDAGALAKKLVPDNDLSFQFGPVGGGVTGDINVVAQAIFERMIVSQRPAKREHIRRDDEAVWSVFQNAFRTQGITRALRPIVVSTPDFEIPFKHAFKNEK